MQTPGLIHSKNDMIKLSVSKNLPEKKDRA